MRLTQLIKYMVDMDRAAGFSRDTLGLELRFASPDWSEFETGETVRPSTSRAISPRRGGGDRYGVRDIEAFHAKASRRRRVPAAAQGEARPDARRIPGLKGAAVSVSGRQ